MLNQNQSKRINLIKLFIVFPFLGVFLVGFNSKEIIKFSEESIVTPIEYSELPTFISPLKQNDILNISSGFGPAISPFTKKMEIHTGIDLVAKIGKAVSASAKGTVRISELDANNGNYIIIDHENGYSTKYSHLDDRSFYSGDHVKSGEVIGHVGTTGKSTGAHLHFDIIKAGKAIDPASLIPFKIERKAIKSQNETVKASKASEQIELIIDKNTSDVQLLKMKSDLIKDKIDFSYTTVRNDKSEIKSLTLNVNGGTSSSGKFNSSYESSSDQESIKPTHISINLKKNSISIGNSKTYEYGSKSQATVWASNDSDSGSKEIIVKKTNGKKVITINGEEINEDDLEDMEIHQENDSNIFILDNNADTNNNKIKVFKSNKVSKGRNVFIHSDSDDDHDVKVITKEGNGFFFIDSDGDKNEMVIVNGKKSNIKKLRNFHRTA